ncbi:MAG: type VI secretion system contractile sheath small subunit [Archangium sp.]|nr:type VI secretion system contractile sheath small subunit [Archangium sp.]
MSKDGSVAPKERVNITYKTQTGDAQEEIELPLKILMLGDYTGKADSTPVEERQTINVDKDNFKEVMANQNLGTAVTVPNKLDDKGGEMNVDLKFKGLDDFTPEGIVNQVPELKKLLELREALNALKSPIGNNANFRKKLQTLLGDDAQRAALMKELGMGEEEKK